MSRLFILLLFITAPFSQATSLEDQAMEPEDVKECFQKDSPFLYCIFLTKNNGWVVLDQNHAEPYQVYIFDNGPDYAENGLYRIRKNNKIGYADEKTGKIVIEPKYDCAFPFEHGKAKVGLNCEVESDGEHSWWTGGDWTTINKKGQVLKK